MGTVFLEKGWIEKLLMRVLEQVEETGEPDPAAGCAKTEGL